MFPCHSLLRINVIPLQVKYSNLTAELFYLSLLPLHTLCCYCQKFYFYIYFKPHKNAITFTINSQLSFKEIEGEKMIHFIFTHILNIFSLSVYLCFHLLSFAFGMNNFWHFLLCRCADNEFFHLLYKMPSFYPYF